MENKKSGMDLLVSFDTTGSMYPVLSQVRKEVAAFVTDMFNSIDDLRVGVIAHGDYCDKDDPYTIRIMDFTTDKDKICDFVKNTAKTYGGDADECYELVLNNARTTMDWEAGRLKVFVLIGDASPHGVNYPGNKGHIDWANEAGLLNDLGVKIFAVHALSYYRDGSRRFYENIANITGGKYLTLDQFDEVVDLIKATCMAEYSEEKLNEFVSIIRSKGKFTRTMARNIGRLSGKSYEAEIKKVQKDGLIPVTPGRFQVMTVENDSVIKDFVEDNGITFKRGRGFYELTKHETVQQYKEVIIQDRETGEMFTGAQVRERLGLHPQVEKGGLKESLSSRDTAEFRVFVQSTSYNRKLIGGTAFLYEVEDLTDTGTLIDTEIEKKSAKVEKDTKKKASGTKTKKDTVKTKSDIKETKKAVGTMGDTKTEVSGELPPIPSDIIEVTSKSKVDKDRTKAKMPTKRTITKYSDELYVAVDNLKSVLSDKSATTEEMEKAIASTFKTSNNLSKYLEKFC